MSDRCARRVVAAQAPEQVLEGDDAPAPAPRAAQADGSTNPKPVSKPKTYVKDKDDPYANVGRNDPCPCGSGKKFKKCHGMYVD